MSDLILLVRVLMFLTPLRGVIKSTRGIVMYYKKSFKRRGGYSSFRGRKSSVRRGKRIKKYGVSRGGIRL